MLVCLLFLSEGILTQPQRDVSRLHRFPYHIHQIVAKCVEVRLLPQSGGEDV
jgi:hypothetical protein